MRPGGPPNSSGSTASMRRPCTGSDLGEVMGIDRSLGRAYYKAMLAAGNALPTEGAVYVTVRDEDKPAILPVASRLAKVGLRIYATRGTAQFLREHGVDAKTVYRISENLSPDAL